MGFGFNKKSEGDDDSNRLALFGSRSKNKSPAPSNNPYAQPTAPPDAYTQAKIQAGVAPAPSGYGASSGPTSGYGGMNNNPYGNQQRNPYGEKNYNSEPKSGYAPDRYGNQGGYGGDNKYGNGPSGGGSRYGPGGYGGLGNTDPNDPGAADRDALFGGARDRYQERQQHPSAPPPPYSQGNGAPRQTPITDAAGLDTSYGAYQDRQLTAEEEEEEDIQATKQEIRFMKQQDVSSTRNALRVAAQAEESGRSTLARLGAQGERIHNTEKNLDLAANQNRTAQEKARELKSANGSMFAIHVSNPFTSSSRRQKRDEEIITRHQEERMQREETRQAAFRAGQRLDQNFKAVNAKGKGMPNNDAKSRLAERSKYQFEQDSEDDEMENEIESNLDALSGAAGRLNALAKATGQEIEEQNKQLDVITGKSDYVDDQIHMNRTRLDRIR